MPFLSALSGVADVFGIGSSAASILGSKGSGSEPGSGGFLEGDSSGAVLGNRGSVVKSETLSDPLDGRYSKPMQLGSMKSVPVETSLGRGRFKGKLKKVNEFLGSDLGRVGQNIGGQFLADARQARNKKKHFEFLESKGLNPFEAAGMGGGQAGAAPLTSLGQAPAAVSAGHPSQRKSSAEIDKILAERERIELDMVRMRIENENYFPLKLAGMGPENMKAALAVFNSGLDAEAILKAAGDNTAAESAAGKKLLGKFLEITGASGGAIGWAELIRSYTTGVADFGGAIGNRDPIGSFFK